MKEKRLIVTSASSPQEEPTKTTCLKVKVFSPLLTHSPVRAAARAADVRGHVHEHDITQSKFRPLPGLLNTIRPLNLPQKVSTRLLIRFPLLPTEWPREQYGPLAQLAEQRTFNPRVAGSSPARPIKVLGRNRNLTYYYNTIYSSPPAWLNIVSDNANVSPSSAAPLTLPEYAVEVVS